MDMLLYIWLAKNKSLYMATLLFSIRYFYIDMY